MGAFDDIINAPENGAPTPAAPSQPKGVFDDIVNAPGEGEALPQQETSLLKAVGEGLISPAWNIPKNYNRQVEESVGQMKRGVGQVESGEPWEMAKGVGNTALGAMGYVGAPAGALLHTFVGAPVEETTGSPLLGGLAETAAGVLAPIPKEIPSLRRAPKEVPPEEAFGVTPWAGENERHLPTTQKIQRALRNQAGEPAYDVAQARLAQRQEQIEASKDVATSQLNPTGEVLARTPEEAADAISSELRDRQAAKGQDMAAEKAALDKNIADEGEALRAKGLIHPHEAAEAVADALRGSTEARTAAQEQTAQRLANERETIRGSLAPNRQVIAGNPQEAADVISAGVTRAEEQATEARDAAYERVAAMPGTYQPRAFTNVANDVRRTLNDPADPVIVNDKITPMTQQAVEDLDRVLGEPARTAADPDTKSFAPFTPRSLDDVRKRLVAYQKQANATARATNDYSDVRGMGRVVDAFDDLVANATRNRGTFSGNGRAVLAAQQEARAAHANLRQTFSPQGKGDTVGPIMNKIVGQREGQAAPANQIDQWLTGNGPIPVLFGRRLQDVFGPNSPEIGAAKQSLYSKAVDSPRGMEPLAPEDIADNLHKLANSELGRTHFTPQELASLRQHADATRATIPARRPSTDVVGTAIDKINGVGGQGWTSAELSKSLFGAKGTGESPLGVKMAQHVANTYGRDSDAFRMLQRGQMSALTKAAEGRAGFDPETTAGNIREFLDGKGKPMSEAIYSPENRDVLRAYADKLDDYAKRSQAKLDDYAARTKTQAADKVEKALARITGSDGQRAATAHEVLNMLSGPDNATKLGLINRLKNELPPEKFAALKQGLFRSKLERGPADTKWGPQKIVNNIDDLFNDSPQMAKALYSPEDRAMIRAYQDMHRKMIVPQAGANWSNNLFNKVSNHLGVLIASALGYATGLPLVGETAALTVGHGIDMARNQLRARKIAKLMPEAGQRMAEYQKAVAAAQRTALPQYQTRAALAGSALADSLRPLGIDMKKLQSPSPARAQDQGQNNQNVPGVGQQKNGGSVKQQGEHRSSLDDSPPVKPKDHPLITGAKLAPDGLYYLPDPNRPGKFLKVIERGSRPAAA